MYIALESKVHLFTDVGVWKSILFIIHLIVIAIFEELLFRVLVLGTLLKSVIEKLEINFIKAALISSIIFGLFHYLNLFVVESSLIGVTSQVIFAFGLGMVFCGSYTLTGSILTPIVLHFLFNLYFGGTNLLKEELGISKVVLSDPDVTNLTSSALIGTIVLSSVLSLIGASLILISNLPQFIDKRQTCSRSQVDYKK